MKIAITARIRNGILWEAVKIMGSQSALASHLGIRAVTLGLWLNFKNCPDFSTEKGQDKWATVETKLIELTGCSLDEIFPPEVRNKAFLQREKRMEKVFSMPASSLAAMGAIPQLLPAPDERVFALEGREKIDEVLSELKDREAEILKRRFGLIDGHEMTLEEVANDFGISRCRVGQIEAKALRRLRHPSRSRRLRPWAAVA